MVRIITDSAADFEPAELHNMQITCIPLVVLFGEDSYYENETLSKNQFYQLLASSASSPKTAQASPQILMDLFEAAGEAGDEAIYITLSSALSGTYQNAEMAKRLVDSDRCYVVDSRNGTGGQRMVVEYAARLRDAGKNACQIIEALEAMRDRVELYACIDTLEYLYRGGRISQTAYKLGTLANIKPIISVDKAGHVTVPAKAMGMRKGMEQLCKRVTVKKPDPQFPLYVMYTNNRDVGKALAQKLEAMGIFVPDERLIQVGAAIGSHIGPEACGLVYVAEEE